MRNRNLLMTMILCSSSLLFACSSSSGTGTGTNPNPGNGNGNGNGSGSGSDTGTQGAKCTCAGASTSDFCQSTGDGSGCASGYECVSYGGSSPICATPCDSTSASPSASCGGGTSCTVHLEGSSDIGDWCE